jgi:hypothetical protein
MESDADEIETAESAENAERGKSSKARGNCVLSTEYTVLGGFW